MATKTATMKTNGSAIATDAAAKAAFTDYEALKEDISQLRADIASLAGNSGKYIKTRSATAVEQGVEHSKEAFDKAKVQANKGKDYLEDKVRENPLASIGIAFGTGVLLAALRRR